MATLPREQGQRHRKLFEFARHLKADPSLAGAELGSLRRLVQEWHKRALPSIATKDFEETWIDFCEAWERVRFPIGQEPVRAIV